MNFLKKMLNPEAGNNNGYPVMEEKISLDITGMTCDHCAVSIERLLEKKKGILSKKVSYASGKGELTYNPDVFQKTISSALSIKHPITGQKKRTIMDYPILKRTILT